jgi:signal transduction histidine kinase
MLREDRTEPVDEPAPGLGRLEALVESIRSAGLDVVVTVEGEPGGLQRALDLSAYRILQEALTNVVKHARARHVDVRVRYGRRRLELEVRDDGAGAAADNGAGGHGLVGMRERAALFGGELDAGPSPGGGYAVRARLPLGSA